MPVILKGARAEILPISAFDITEMLHPSQLLVEEQAFRPVPQENSLFVEQAEKPVLENRARCEIVTISAS
ncbi:MULTISPECIES: hypothetical protein [unclassified Microcoleus]|uniref:hypothetical protein n=1 Tax=unclassified Microcoleus TaxID=2642155 RepID=UPI002FD26AC6